MSDRGWRWCGALLVLGFFLAQAAGFLALGYVAGEAAGLEVPCEEPVDGGAAV